MTAESNNADLGITPYTFSDSDLLAIGRIIRGCAEIEDIVSVHLCQVADISEGQLLVLLGRSTLRSKIDMAEKLAKVKSEAAWNAHKACLKHPEFEKLIRCRNAIAHGILLGQSEGLIVLRTATAARTNDDMVTIQAQRFAPSDLVTYANLAEELIPQFDTFLRTKALREERL